ncbi:hypothetical protein IE4872_PB00017 (plasmid) [Rhizobium gallicum]|uniref:Uncharacterized protein n=1 Tax=Rhizobium gallicum TaxID=56730 RepID=A0A1L5NPR6_9HYPH|nr:hypothetical protein IE4872_PB00017 [Rhizobium gallicum]
MKSLGFEPNEELDAALRDLYKLCVDVDAPILAHGYSSNGSGPDYVPISEAWGSHRAVT